MTYVYIIIEEGCEETGPCKIGFSVAPNDRIVALNSGNWRKLLVADSFEFISNRTRFVEEYIHEILSDKLIQREWFDVTPKEAAEKIREIREQGWLPDPWREGHRMRTYSGRFKVV